MSARFRPAGVQHLGHALATRLERMIAIQMEAAPSHWSEAERRSWAETLLLGGRPAA